MLVSVDAQGDILVDISYYQTKKQSNNKYFVKLVLKIIFKNQSDKKRQIILSKLYFLPLFYHYPHSVEFSVVPLTI